jgi:hypothetical protein
LKHFSKLETDMIGALNSCPSNPLIAAVQAALEAQSDLPRHKQELLPDNVIPFPCLDGLKSDVCCFLDAINTGVECIRVLLEFDNGKLPEAVDAVLFDDSRRGIVSTISKVDEMLSYCGVSHPVDLFESARNLHIKMKVLSKLRLAAEYASPLNWLVQ